MKILNAAAWMVATALVVVLLVYGKSLLIPFVIALVVWYVIVGLNNWIGSFEFIRKYCPGWLSATLAMLIIVLFLVFVGEMIANNAQSMADSLPTYEQNVRHLMENVQQSFGLEQVPNVSSLLEGFDFTDIISNFINTFSGIAGNIFLILIYVLFLFLEQVSFPLKLQAIFNDEEDYGRVQGILIRINKAISSYISVKTAVSVLTGVLSYIVMAIIGLDFAAFWAFLIFLLNYIPSIGSLIATAFPSLMAILQFETLTPFIIILIGVGAIQLIVGNVIEPRMMGSSLNISSLVMILSLSLWGTLWGVSGMVLCVPITVIMMIIFAQFESTKPIAILLSANGKVAQFGPEELIPVGRQNDNELANEASAKAANSSE
ncbi:MAG: AI-2E family transporter [Saprospiraceae bacterium]|nr:AI-2E family transporter [Saprospiraceae bacterium]